MKVVKAARVEDFKQYVAGRVSQTLKQHIALFLAKLSGATNAATVEHICVEEKGWFETQYQNGNTRAAHMTKYRKAIALMCETRTFPDAVTYEQETQAGAVRQHLALKWMNYSSEFHESRQAVTKAKKPKAKKRTTVHIDGLLKERFEAFGDGTPQEKMAQLLDAAKCNKRLERHLHTSAELLFDAKIDSLILGLFALPPETSHSTLRRLRLALKKSASVAV